MAMTMNSTITMDQNEDRNNKDIGELPSGGDGDDDTS